jgi:hypothetical protein
LSRTVEDQVLGKCRTSRRREHRRTGPICIAA